MKENRTYKLYWVAGLFFLAFSFTMSSCSKNEEPMPTAQHESKSEDVSTRSDVINAVTVPEEVGKFFSTELPAYGQHCFWDCGGWSPDSKDQYPDEICEVIQSKEQLAVIYKGTEELPDIDFTKYSLVIGRTNAQVDKLVSIEIKDMGISYNVFANCLYYTNVGHFDSLMHFYCWGLFPKLDNKPANMHIVTTEALYTDTNGQTLIVEKTPSEEAKAFFDSELPAHDIPSFFEGEGSWYPDEQAWGNQFCKFINSEEELKALYKGKKALPAIDFANTTVIIGRDRSTEYFSFERLYNLQLAEKDGQYIVRLTVAHKNIDTLEAGFDGHTNAEEIIHYWRMYPKLTTKPVTAEVAHVYD